MKFTVQQYAQALYESFQETKPGDYDKIIDNLLRTLKDNNDLGRYEAIVEAYEDLDRKNRGVKQVELTMAHDLEVNSKIVHQLNDIVGSDVEVQKKVDERLIGGVVLKVEDTLIDGSVKGQLNQLKKNLSQ